MANSYKRGGRCIAGIEIRFNASGHWGIVRDTKGKPVWIRPVTKTPYGEVPTDEALTFELLSIVRVIDADPCPNCAHSENVYYTRLERTHLKVQLSDVVGRYLFDNIHKEIFYNHGKAIHPTVYAKGHYSLMFLKPDNALVYVDIDREKPQFRMDFSYQGVRYDFPITDPDFLDFLRDDPDQIGDFYEILITVSLGLEHEGWHHKLVAGVFGYKRRETILPTIDDVEETTLLKEPEAPSYMEQQKQIYANAYAKWSEEDDALLWQLFSQGASVTELMEHFRRNRGSIRSRLKKLAEVRLWESTKNFNHAINDEVSEATKEHAWKKLISFLRRG